MLSRVDLEKVERRKIVAKVLDIIVAIRDYGFVVIGNR